jgi:hypothetical protein
MTALLSSDGHNFFGFLTRTKSALLRFASAIEKLRMRQVQREIEFHLRLHNISLKHDDIGFMSGLAKRSTKPKSSVK